MIKVHTINNLSNSDYQTAYTHNGLENKVAELVRYSMIITNENTYTQNEMEGVSQNKTSQFMLGLLNKAFTVYLTNEKDDLIGCGMVVKQDNKYFAKTLHIAPDYRGLGYAQQICDIRENFLRSIGAKEIYIESLKYPKTIEFHTKRGFVEIPPYRQLKYTILMKKKLY